MRYDKRSRVPSNRVMCSRATSPILNLEKKNVLIIIPSYGIPEVIKSGWSVSIKQVIESGLSVGYRGIWVSGYPWCCG